MAAAPTATVAAAATGAPQALLDAPLDRHNKHPLHLLLESAGIELTDTKKPSRFYARFHGASALEVAVTLGREAAAAALLAAGASVRPQAFDALLLYCPPHARDHLAALLVRSQACPVPCILPRWPLKYRHAVQALLCCALRGRQQASNPAAAGQPAAEQQQEQQQQHGTETFHAALLASLPHEVLLRIAALAAAPLSAWQ
ncbi:alpha beta hydrolase [Chlorella sorokiniana]|uniref:Alpha beta hydrolase n=1 Tax=Chlorella sorokiniana TaxID=3076 RepID=A0A2P6TIL2_CHLSO|nr:alpha beta hydrolase [Chlorella sorokiniana]|eukprot:PRW39088.1 alpha beta hydrolase [Chlorella sorokiniana]